MVRWVERDDETIAAIRAREIEFWQRIQSGDAPDPVTPEDVKWLYPKDSGASLEADIELLEACGDLKALKANAKDLDAQIELLTTRVKARMGEAAFLLGPNGKPVATWKTQVSNRLNVESFSKEQPDMKNKYSTKTEYRVFLIK
jgi:predicted phage-related endonuclease